MKQIMFFAMMLIASYGLNAQVTNLGTGAGTNGNQSTHIGFYSGNSSLSTSESNTLVGAYAGRFTTGNSNAFFGRSAGYENIDGSNNAFIGTYAGAKNTSGTNNTFTGVSAGYQNTTGNGNTFIGRQAGADNKIGSDNTAIGRLAGYKGGGSNNVFIGYRAGYYETGNDRLYIDNSNTSTPLIYGNFASDELTFNATVRVGNVSAPGNYKLYVDDGILTEKVKVASVGSGDWADYVFEDDYDLNSTEEVEAFIQENKHLPNVPSAKEVTKDGIDMVEMDATLLRQIEELWLHVIEFKKENEALKIEVSELKQK